MDACMGSVPRREALVAAEPRGWMRGSARAYRRDVQPGSSGGAGSSDRPLGEASSAPTPRPPLLARRRAQIALVSLSLLLALVVAAAILWRARDREPTLDPTTIPATIARELPSRERCAVVHVTVLDTWFSVSVESEDVPGRTLDYRIYATGAVRGLEQHGLTLPPLDLRAVDWRLVARLRGDLEDRAASGQRVPSVMLRPCTYTSAERPAKPCLEAAVVTSAGRIRRVTDAETGELVDER